MRSYDVALQEARRLDPHADHVDKLPDVLLVDVAVADRVLAQNPGAYRDDNDPPTAWTRIVLPEVSE